MVLDPNCNVYVILETESRTDLVGMVPHIDDYISKSVQT